MNLTLFHRDVVAQYPGLLNELDQLVTRINTVFGAAHDPQTGAHTSLAVTQLVWDGDVQLTVGAAGAAAAPPATPSVYLPITIGATRYVVPLYEAN